MAKGTTTATAEKKKEATASLNGASAFDAAKYRRFYEQMVHIREFEELIAKEWNDKSHGMGGYLHLYSGEEAIAVGIIGALDIPRGDCFIGHYRDHGYALAAGSDPGQVMAEICGKQTGCSKGKGGSMHICDAALGFYGGYGIVGGNVPIALGLGWSIKYRGGDQVAVCFFGDGSINQGAFHETLNMAQLYRVPVLFVLENNGYAMGTSIERSHANTELYTRVDSYAMKRDKIDGQNIVTVHERASEIVAEMRKNPAPFFLECTTYRYHGHGAADTPVTQSTYRTRQEVEEWRTKRDPLDVAERILIEHDALTEDDINRIQAEALEAAKAAMKFSDDSPYPPAEELLKDVYV
jgi:pyruvate dehydrogenase E1 component alpha subunit